MIMYEMMKKAHDNAKEKGFWDGVNKDDPRHVICMLALAQGELTEAIEDIRLEKDFTEEIADCIIRLFDLSEGMDLDLPNAIIKKMDKNKRRGYLHGKRL